MTSSSKGPPQLIFDDGTRAMVEEASVLDIASPRGSIPLSVYYEIDRLSKEIMEIMSSITKGIWRIALQFPDELLEDSPEVCWMLEDEIKACLSSSNERVSPFCFVLGDTTVNSCCPDEVAALHLNADVLVHYGHACLSPTGSLPILYSFGTLPVDIPQVVAALEAARAETEQKQFLVLYQVGYHHAIQDLEDQWRSVDENLTIVTGKIPSPQKAKVACCGPSGESQEENSNPLVVGGLELPLSSWEDLIDYTVVFLMNNPEEDAENYSTDDLTTPQQRQYANSLLCLESLPQGPPGGGYWICAPSCTTATVRRNVRPPPAVARQLKRRFFLTQKAKDANVFGILVSNLSQQHLVKVVTSLQKLLQEEDRSYYSFAVGKINPAKLANFAEIETFVMVACREHSLLDQEKEYPIPIITPMELEIALDHRQWGMQAYSLDCQDVLEAQTRTAARTLDDDETDDSDAPYFSMVTGRYESRKNYSKSSAPLDLEALPGKGQVTEYNSSAANFLKEREYQGLETKMGETEVKSAVMGLQGIASEYNAPQTQG